MKQIICRRFKLKIPVVLVLAIFWGHSGPVNSSEEEVVYQIIGPQIPEKSPIRPKRNLNFPSPQSSPPMGERRKSLLSAKWTRAQLEARAGFEEISSLYSDKALGYEGSKFRAVSFSGLVDLFDPEGRSDAVLLNCFDDYQGILSIADIRRYNIQLATRITIRPEFNKPDWLNPLMVIVPDNRKAPFQERYLTANIRELKFTRLSEYYAPFREVGGASSGYSAFKDNCLFCHSLMGIGGNKGIRLLESYDFSRMEGENRFKKDFAAFHHKENADKQNVEQFISESQLKAITEFLRRVNDFVGPN